jgi:hypothetical protein
MTLLLAAIMLGQDQVFAKEPLPFFVPLKPKIHDKLATRHVNGKDVSASVRMYVFDVPVTRVLQSMRTNLKKNAGWQHSTDTCGGVFYDRYIKKKHVEGVHYSTVVSAGTCDVYYERYGEPK